VCSSDLLVQPAELPGVIHALRAARIGVVGIAESSLREQPRVAFVAFWGVGKPEPLAAGFKKALDQLAHG